MPNKLTEIKGYTFIECTSLTDVFIPPSVTTIAPNSFKDCTNLSAIYGYVGSYAETFAAENNYQFVGFQEPYEDVTFDDWFFLAVESMYNTGLMTGTTPTTFDPAVPMNRAQFATVLYRLAGEPEVEYAPYYPDVPDGWFYSDAITWDVYKRKGYFGLWGVLLGAEMETYHNTMVYDGTTWTAYEDDFLSDNNSQFDPMQTLDYAIGATDTGLIVTGPVSGLGQDSMMDTWRFDASNGNWSGDTNLL